MCYIGIKMFKSSADILIILAVAFDICRDWAGIRFESVTSDKSETDR